MARRVADGALRVEGLVELHRALKALGPEVGRELGKAGKPVAERVARDARAAATMLGGVAAHVAPTVKATSVARYAGVRLGHEAAAGAEFGGQRRPTTQQFKPWRGNGDNAGYFLFPTIRRDMDEIEAEYTDALDSLLKKAGLV